ncbi:metal-sensitive transcriptional regulator [Streptomyces sp. NPDC046237]|uniref:metal-sensitive transcriptional regulator n=1 Tax=Streptomyces sp. NPDC046237 TaxID=3154914 RepID=UPI0033CFAF14
MPHKEDIIRRLRRIEGQVRGVQRMVDEDVCRRTDGRSGRMSGPCDGRPAAGQGRGGRDARAPARSSCGSDTPRPTIGTCRSSPSGHRTRCCRSDPWVRCCPSDPSDPRCPSGRSAPPRPWRPSGPG